jgi:hypothetical protein
MRPKLPLRWVASPAFDAGRLDWDAYDADGEHIANINDDALLGYGVWAPDAYCTHDRVFYSLERVNAFLRLLWHLPKPARFTRGSRRAV